MSKQFFGNKDHLSLESVHQKQKARLLAPFVAGAEARDLDRDVFTG